MEAFASVPAEISRPGRYPGLEVLSEGVPLVRISRPPANALTTESIGALREVFSDLRGLGQVPPGVLTGEGDRFFCAGGDIKELEDAPTDLAVDRVSAFHRMVVEIETYPAPVIGAVRGYAVGGGLELTLACDRVVGGRSSTYGFPEINNGLLPAIKGMQLAAQLVGLRRASHMLYTGDLLDAQTAQSWGLIDSVVDNDEVIPAAVALAQQLGEKDSTLFGLIKLRLRQPVPAFELEDMTAADMRTYFVASGTREARERFVTKRPKP